MPEVLVEVTRGPLVESVHRGDIAVVNSSGKLLHYAGDPFRMISMRSSAKPIQAMNAVLCGAAEKFGFNDEELSIMCASHYGEDFHRQVIRGMLEKMGLSEDNLHCGTIPAPISVDYMVDLISRGFTWQQSNSECSGKHCGFLASCLKQGFPIENYDKFENPMQQQILEIIAKMCEVDKEKILIGEDGCGVPVHGVPLYNTALGFAKFSNTEKLESEYKTACDRICTAMINAPQMLAGTGAFDTELIKNTKGKLIAKIGAEAVYGVGIIGKDLGIALKIEDGDWMRAVNPVVMSVLKQLDLLTPEELKSLSQFSSPVDNTNYHGRVVGEIRTVFKLINL
jgi:L-asparaginase II